MQTEPAKKMKIVNTLLAGLGVALFLAARDGCIYGPPVVLKGKR
jgi:hypothetical protein